MAQRVIRGIANHLLRLTEEDAPDFKLNGLNYHKRRLAPSGLSYGLARSGLGHILVGPDIDVARDRARFRARLMLILINRH